MVEDQNPLTCNAFNVLFKQTKFLDTNQTVFRGQLKEVFEDKFADDEDETFLMSKYLYFTTKQKFITYGDGEGSLEVQKE